MSVSATRTERATSESLEYVSEAVAAAGVLRTAVRLGVLDQLDAELGLHLRTGSGGVHPLEAYREWLAEVGFQAPEIHELLDDFPLTLIIARKPSE